jgi:hypothetical protein
MNEYILRIAVPEQFDLLEVGLAEVSYLLTEMPDWEILEIEEA